MSKITILTNKKINKKEKRKYVIEATVDNFRIYNDKLAEIMRVELDCDYYVLEYLAGVLFHLYQNEFKLKDKPYYSSYDEAEQMTVVASLEMILNALEYYDRNIDDEKFSRLYNDLRCAI